MGSSFSTEEVPGQEEPITPDDSFTSPATQVRRQRRCEDTKVNSALKKVLGAQATQEIDFTTLYCFSTNLIYILMENSPEFRDIYKYNELILIKTYNSDSKSCSYYLRLYFNLEPSPDCLRGAKFSCHHRSSFHSPIRNIISNSREIFLKLESNEVTPEKYISWLKSIWTKFNYKIKNYTDETSISILQHSQNSYSFILNLLIRGIHIKLHLIPHFQMRDKSVCPAGYYDFLENGCWAVFDKLSNIRDNRTTFLQLFKLLKRVGEVFRWRNLSDYILLTLLDSLPGPWDDIHLGQTFLEALRRLHTAVQQGYLPHREYISYNLLSSLSPQFRTRLSSDLSTLIAGCNKADYINSTLLKENPFSSPYPPLNAIDNILKKIKIDDAIRTQNIDIITKLMEKTKAIASQDDKLFRTFFKNIEYTGSYYENLRVKKADEFDLNFVFFWPYERFTTEEHIDPNLPVFKKIKVDISSYSRKPKYAGMKEEFNTFLTADFYLDRNKFTKWFIGVMDRACNKLPSSTLQLQKLNRSVHGPAITWNLQYKPANNIVQNIDLDLVPVFSFSFSDHPLRCVDRSKAPSFSDEDWNWFLVPKPMRDDVNSELLWRVHLLYAERKFLDIPHESFKPTIRLVKLLRDKNNWKTLASYFLKCMAFHCMLEKRDSPDYWHKRNMNVCLYDMLVYLKECLNQHCLPSFFFPDYNLFHGINPATLENIANYLDNILHQMSSNPEPYFL